MFAIAKMPYEMAMKDELSRRQFYANTQRLVAALEAAQAEVERLAEMLRELEGREQRDEALLRQALEALELRCAKHSEEREELIPALRERLGVKV